MAKLIRIDKHHHHEPHHGHPAPPQKPKPCGERLPKRISCLDCVYLTRLGSVWKCGIDGRDIPIPSLYVCGHCTLTFPNRRDGICKRCCTDGTCGPHDHDEDGYDRFGHCVEKGKHVNSCKGDGPPEKCDIWAHNRCGNPHDTIAGHGQLCRRCCGDDGECGPKDDDCKCCRTIQERMNF